MKMKSLSVKGFKGIQDMSFEPSTLNFLSGPNGAGKSSITGAIQFLLTGNIPTDAIRHGDDCMTVEAELDDGTKIGRVVYLPESSMIDGEEVKTSAFAEKVKKYAEDIFSIVEEHTHVYFTVKEQAVLHTFLETGKTDARLSGVKELEVTTSDGTVLYRRVSKPSRAEVNGKKVSIQMFDEVLAQHGLASKSASMLVSSSELMNQMEMKEFGNRLLDIVHINMDFDQLCEAARITGDEKEALKPLFPETPAIIHIPDIAKAYKTLTDIRADIGRNAEAALRRSVFEHDYPTLSKAEAEEKLAIIMKKKGAYAALKKTHYMYNQQMESRKKALAAIDRYNAQAESLKDVVKPDDNAMAANKEALESSRKAMEALNSAYKSICESQKLLNQMLDNLETKICPLCESLECTTDKTACRDDLKKKCKDNYERSLKIREQYQKEKVHFQNLQQKDDALQKARELWIQKTSLLQTIESLKASIQEEPEKPDPLPDMNGLDEQCRQLQNIIRLHNLKKEADEARESYLKSKNQYDFYTVLIQKANPKKGLLMRTLLNSFICPLETKAKKSASELFQADIRFAMDDKGLTVLYRNTGAKDFLSAESLSKGEKMELSFILMDMVSSISGSNILVFDNMESLDLAALKDLAKFASRDEVKKRYDHIFFAAVNHAGIREAFQTEAFQMISL